MEWHFVKNAKNVILINKITIAINVKNAIKIQMIDTTVISVKVVIINYTKN